MTRLQRWFHRTRFYRWLHDAVVEARHASDVVDIADDVKRRIRPYVDILPALRWANGVYAMASRLNRAAWARRAEEGPTA